MYEENLFCSSVINDQNQMQTASPDEIASSTQTLFLCLARDLVLLADEVPMLSTGSNV